MLQKKEVAMIRRPLPALLALSLLAVAGCRTEQPLRFAVTFEHAQGIEAGDEVHYQGLEIGEVKEVDVDSAGAVRVTVEVEPKYRGAVARDSVVEVERAGVLGGRELVIRDGEDAGERIPLADGEVLVGREGELDDAVARLRSVGATAMERMRELGSDVQDRLTELGDSQQAQELAAAMERVREQMGDAGREGAQRLREEGLPAVRDRAEELRRALEAEGRGEEARDVLERVQRWLEETGAELDGKAGSPPSAEGSS